MLASQSSCCKVADNIVSQNVTWNHTNGRKGLGHLLDTSVLSALEVLRRLMRYINLLTYLLTRRTCVAAMCLPYTTGFTTSATCNSVLLKSGIASTRILQI